jgi:hypothetical protein
MPLPGAKVERKMTDKLRGSFGSFTISGPLQMSFVSSRLKVEDLQLLKTARQILPRRVMTIRELMQRDIDDKRVQNDIVNYLTPKPGQFNPKFFPPLVVAILVRDKNSEHLAEKYPTLELKDSELVREFDPNDQVWYEEWFYGSAFGLRIPLEDKETITENSEFFHGAELSWNRDQVDLLVIDGQHRLVALKAALGILDEEEVVRGYQESRLSPTELEELGFNSVPVSIIFPPKLYEANDEIPIGRTLVSVFRQVFVDVNKNAKPVSDSVNILLNEQDLIAIFTRNIIESFVTEENLPEEQIISSDSLPLYIFEWDSRDKKEYQINDLRAISSVGILYQIISSLIFYERKDENFRTELNIEEGDPKIDPRLVNAVGPITVDINPENFASWQRLELEQRFKGKWQEAIIYIFRNIFPGKKLVETLEEKRIELLKQKSAEPLNPTPRLSYEYLVGTKTDQFQIEMIAKEYEHPVGRFDPVNCGIAVENIKFKFLNEKIDPQIRGGHFSRLFFSNLGQTQLFEFIFRTLYHNIPSYRSIPVFRIANNFVDDFNNAFSDNLASERLFEPVQVWNTAIQTLGTQQWRQNNVSGLLKISLVFFRDIGAISHFFDSQEGWNSCRGNLYLSGINDIRESLSSRLPNQLRFMSEVTEIADETLRRNKLSELVEQRTNEILNKLNDFVKKHSQTSLKLPERIK